MANEPKKPDFSNVQGGAKSSAPPPAPKADFGNVQSGAASTAKREYGNANRWRAIFEANRDQLDDPDLIKPGQVLRIPADTDSND